MRPHFRFEDLEIWQLARSLAVKLHKLADELDKRRLYRYAEQLRAAGLSLTKNIAEGSGSTYAQEFKQFLNIARRSLFEDTSFALGPSPSLRKPVPILSRVNEAVDHVARVGGFASRTGKARNRRDAWQEQDTTDPA